jgi:excinuclease ABC subunit C
MVDLSGIPKNPGCYLFKDSKGKVIYAGKGKSLDKRVRSYFVGEHDIKTNFLVSHIDSVDYVVTDSEVEALILENNLIKKYKPRYNIDLKDSKRYAYIERTAEEVPRLLIARKREGSGKFYGPFVSGMSRDYVLRALRNIFKLRTCVKLPKKHCMRYEIGLCTAPCEGLISRRDYLERVKAAEMVLKGKTKEIVEILTKRMKGFSIDEDFERALEIREQIKAIKELGEKQKMERDKKYDEDFINWIVDPSVDSHKHQAGQVARVYLILFNARKGILENKQFFEFDWTSNFLEEFLVQFYSDYDVPKEIVLPPLDTNDQTGRVGKIDKGMRDFLKERGGEVVVPKSGEKLKLLELVKKNIRLQVFGGNDRVRELGNKLGLNFSPRIIECFDVSHLSGTNTVASMVLFRDGIADKNSYRRFKIRSVVGNDDYASMREVISRRYRRFAGDGKLAIGYGVEQELPDLIVVDGGKGQLGVAVEVLNELGLKIAVIGIAKREEEVFFPGEAESIRLDKKGDALKLLQEIRDEAHRFAISYQRLLRSKKIRE